MRVMLHRRLFLGSTAAAIAAGCAPMLPADAQTPMAWGVNIHKSYANLNQAGVLARAASLLLELMRFMGASTRSAKSSTTRRRNWSATSWSDANERKR